MKTLNTYSAVIGGKNMHNEEKLTIYLMEEQGGKYLKSLLLHFHGTLTLSISLLFTKKIPVELILMST